MLAVLRISLDMLERVADVLRGVPTTHFIPLGAPSPRLSNPSDPGASHGRDRGEP